MDIGTARSRITCMECGKRKLYFVTSAICPDGHGKMAPMPRCDFQFMVKIVDEHDAFWGLPECAKSKKGLTVDGKKYVRGNKKDFDVAARIEGPKGWRRIYLKDGTKVKSESEAGSTCSVT